MSPRVIGRSISSIRLALRGRLKRKDATFSAADLRPSNSMRSWARANNELALAHERMLLLGRKSAAEKVASFLLSLPRNANRIDEIDLPMTRGDIADYLGLTLETVSRTLSGFVRQQIVRNASPRIVTILDMARLSALAAGESD